jgi:hypothetical protein
MKRTHLLITASILLLTGVLQSCVYSPDPYVRSGRRTGAVVGGITGAVIGNNIKGGNSWGGAAIGAAVGGLAGDRRGKVNSMYYGYGGPRRTGYYYY